MKAPARREQIGEWLNSLGLVGEGVEVGVFQGEFSERLLSTWTGRVLWCVDSWAPVPFDIMLHPCHPSDAARQQWKNNAEDRLRRFKERARIVHADSLDAARFFADGQLDFAYIDAGHDYESVTRDLQAWAPKVRAGGILCGDDFTDVYPGVIRAVREFVSKRGLQLLPTDGATNRAQWYLHFDTPALTCAPPS